MFFPTASGFRASDLSVVALGRVVGVSGFGVVDIWTPLI